jgi:septal ring factor EnvC (AmiA/AmiB activator)
MKHVQDAFEAQIKDLETNLSSVQEKLKLTQAQLQQCETQKDKGH